MFSSSIIRLAVFCMASHGVFAWAAGETPLPSKASCPTAQTLKAEQIYGAWQVEWRDPPQGQPTHATLVLARHEEFSESLAGVLSRALTPQAAKEVGLTQKAAIAGDLEDGFLLLDESSDNVRITATWNGEMVPGSCGQAFQGTWTDTRQTEVNGIASSSAEGKPPEPKPVSVRFTLKRIASVQP